MGYMTREEFTKLDSQLQEIRQYLLRELREEERGSSDLFRMQIKRSLDKIVKAIAKGQSEKICDPQDPQNCCRTFR